MVLEKPATDDLIRTVKRLIQKEKDPRKAAKQVSALGKEAISILCSLSAEEAKRRTRVRWLALIAPIIGLLASLLVIFVLPKGSRDPYQVGANCLMGGGVILSYYLLQNGGKATRALAHFEKGSMVGPLLDAIAAHSRDGILGEKIRETLSPLLRQLKASDASRLRPSHILTLNRELEICRNGAAYYPMLARYTRDVLKALEQVGDETSVPVVEQILQSTQNPHIRHAAEACLPLLRERGALGKNTLLRAADPTVVDLLLPAGSGEATEPNILLRSSQSNEAETVIVGIDPEKK